MYSEEDRYSVEVENISYADFLNCGVELSIPQEDILSYYLAYEGLIIRFKEYKKAELSDMQIVEVYV